MPESRPMAAVGPRCHELRIDDVEQKKEWRVMYYVGRHAIAILEVFPKTTRATLVLDVDARAFPPRLPAQPVFYPVRTRPTPPRSRPSGTPPTRPPASRAW
jgi:hypothetical protein